MIDRSLEVLQEIVQLVEGLAMGFAVALEDAAFRGVLYWVAQELRGPVVDQDVEHMVQVV